MLSSAKGSLSEPRGSFDWVVRVSRVEDALWTSWASL